ncbi:MAG: alpha/beta fold hydrolase [Candidatus Acidiferrales bacterium]
MKLWQIILAIVGVVFLALGARWIRDSELPKQEIWLDAGACHTPMTVLDPPADVKPAGSIVLLHGLAANRRLMMYLAEDFAGHGFRAYALDMPGHGDSRDAFSFLRAQECSTAAVESLIRSGKLDPKSTILLGHSMGAAIAVRMADRDPLAATIAISPAPMNPPQRMPANLLVFSASSDLGILKRTAQSLSDAAGGERTAPEDFVQQRAFDLRRLPHATHTSMLTDRRVAHDSEKWAMQALFPQIAADTLTLNLDLATYETFGRGRRRLAGGILGLFGVLLLFPLAVALAGKAAPPPADAAASSTAPQTEFPGNHQSAWLLLAEGAICAMLGVLLLIPGTPLKFLHLYTGAYLASLLLIAGILLLLFNFGFAMEHATFRARALAVAAILGFATCMAVAAWLNWQLDDAWLNAPRWLRFAGLLPVAWIYCFAEEVALGPVQHGMHRAVRFAVFLLLRLELFLACALAWYLFASGQVLVPLLFAYLALFSTLQRLATDALRSRNRSATAAALFGAILASWFIAGVFPLT